MLSRPSKSRAATHSLKLTEELGRYIKNGLFPPFNDNVDEYMRKKGLTLAMINNQPFHLQTSTHILEFNPFETKFTFTSTLEDDPMIIEIFVRPYRQQTAPIGFASHSQSRTRTGFELVSVSAIGARNLTPEVTKGLAAILYEYLLVNQVSDDISRDLLGDTVRRRL